MTDIFKNTQGLRKTFVIGSTAFLVTGCIEPKPFIHDSVRTTVKTSYTSNNYQDNYYIERELIRLRSESKRLKHETKAIHNLRLEQIKKEQAKLLQLQQDNIRERDRLYQQQKDQQRLEEDRRRQQEINDRYENQKRNDRNAKHEQDLKERERNLQKESDKREADRLAQERQAKQAKVAQDQAHVQAQQAQQAKQDADAAERKHVEDVYRQQEEDRQKKAAASDMAPQPLNKAESIQQQINNDHELALKLAEEELQSKQAQDQAQAQQAQQAKQDAEAAERKHVEEVYRQQEEDRQKKAAASGMAPQPLNKAESIQQQINNDHELALKLAEEELQSPTG